MSTASRTAASPEYLLLRQLDTLQDLSADHRDEFLGANWFDDVRSTYNLTPPVVSTPSFRPNIQIPQMQMLALSEASDLADNNLKVYITGADGKRDRTREQAMMAQWRQGSYDLHTLYASLWSLLGGTGFLQVGFDPLDRMGMGSTYVRWRDPGTCYPDPASISENDWYYFQVTERLWPDEIRRRFPAARTLGLRDPVANRVGGASDELSGRLRMPPGPMSAMGRLPEERQLGPGDGRLQVRYTFIYDSNVRDVVREAGGSRTDVERAVPAKFELLYPNGRYVVDCETLDYPLFDGDNPHPMGQFPIVRVLGLPALTSFWGLPPTRITRDLQDLAVRMLKQVFENAVRLNNGCWFLDEASGLTAEDFGGLPGEIRVVSSNGKNPELKVPPAFPAHFLEYPKWLLGMQKELWGFSPSREGKQAAGNVGADLFESSVMQSQVITRLRGKLLADSMQRLSQLVFYTMAHFQTRGQFPSFEAGFKMTDWKHIPPDDIKKYSIYLDPASVRPMSAPSLRKLVPQLRQMQMLDTRTGLEMLDIPGAGEIADTLEAEKALEALARLKKR